MKNIRKWAGRVIALLFAYSAILVFFAYLYGGGAVGALCEQLIEVTVPYAGSLAVGLAVIMANKGAKFAWVMGSLTACTALVLLIFAVTDPPQSVRFAAGGVYALIAVVALWLLRKDKRQTPASNETPHDEAQAEVNDA